MRPRTSLAWLSVVLTAVGCDACASRSTAQGDPARGAEVPRAPAQQRSERRQAAAPGEIATPRTDLAPTGSATRTPDEADLARYPWLAPTDTFRDLDATFPAPPGASRVALAPRSFGAFLRHLPLRASGSAVHAHDGRTLLEADDPRVAAVIALDAGTRDLQQCADTAIRLHAEWLWSTGRRDELGYHFTSGDLATWRDYAAGKRPKVDGRTVAWSQSAAPTDGHAAFRAWLDVVFTFAGTVSLARDGAPVARGDVRVGDVLVLPGGPGHAVIILDLARDGAGREMALLGQGFMPAQEAHVLASARGEPWFDLSGDGVDTPFWPAPFPWSALRRMRTATGDTE